MGHWTYGYLNPNPEKCALPKITRDYRCVAHDPRGGGPTGWYSVQTTLFPTSVIDDQLSTWAQEKLKPLLTCGLAEACTVRNCSYLPEEWVTVIRLWARLPDLLMPSAARLSELPPRALERLATVAGTHPAVHSQGNRDLYAELGCTLFVMLMHDLAPQLQIENEVINGVVTKFHVEGVFTDTQLRVKQVSSTPRRKRTR